MALIADFPLVGLLLSLVFSSAKGHGGGGGWSNAHATFYGGGDASGTMGIFTKPLIFSFPSFSELVSLSNLKSAMWVAGVQLFGLAEQ